MNLCTSLETRHFVKIFISKKLGLKAIKDDETASAFEMMHSLCLRHAMTRVLHRNGESAGIVITQYYSTAIKEGFA